MKTIKVFLASSDELKEERTHIGDLFTHLNRIFIPRGTYLELSEWEHLDSSMGHQHKQDEYNKELMTCEMCIVMYWTKFGEYTNQEFSIAYNAVKRGTNPKKLYVFFKEPCNASAELQMFKDSFEKDYGHFYCKFDTIDTLKLHFVLQLESYQNSDMLSVEDSKLKFGDYEVAYLSNAPFAYNNHAYNELHIRIQEVNEAIENLKTGSGEWFSKQLSLKIREKEDLLRELNNCENSLLDTALYIARTSTQESSVRMRHAIQSFNEGDITGARNILCNTEIDAEVTFNRLRETRLIYEQELLNAHSAIREILLKASMVMADTSLPIECRFEDACNLYRRAISLSKECSYNIKDHISMLYKYGILLKKHARYKEAYEVFLEQERLTIASFGEKDESLAGLYNNLGIIGRHYNKTIDNSINYYKKSIDILGKIYGFDHTALAYSYCNLGSAYAKLSPCDINASIDLFKKALDLCGDNFYDSHLIATIYNNLGFIYRSQHLYDLSLNYYLKAYDLWESLGSQKVRYIASVHNNIGVIYRKLGNNDLALDNYRKALQIWKTHYGYFHPSVASVYFNIGLLYEESAKYDQAVEYYNHSYKIRRTILEEDHSDTLITKSRLDNAILLEKRTKFLSELDNETNQ